MKKYFIPIISLFVLTIIGSFFIDQEVAIGIFKLQDPILTTIFVYFSYIFTNLTIFLFGALFLIRNKTMIPYMTLGYLVHGFFHIIIKFFINRPRPFIEISLKQIEGFSYDFASWNTTFPSFHVAAMFFMIPFIFKLKSKLRYVWVGLAVLMGIVRIYSGVHYLSDILAGALVGLAFGYLTLYIYEKKARNLFK
ncbi:MAG: phosphatase PAP2 family protein [Candidatus Nanoarchaeia archaeon]|nr:phosphatase PAP2 family protein [Candidatus Nanoarchaeia archaeon]